MSGTTENRATVFTSSSQDVEIQQAGAWWPGSLLGWRHEPDGSCQVWVRAVVAGVERTSWTDLGAVRLPEPSSPRSVPSSPAGTDVLTSTVTLFAVRDGAAGAAATGAGGRRPGGRRRAPETTDHAGAAAAAPVPGAGRAPASPGRHRAPVAVETPAIGRHRAADTGAMPPVRDEGSPRPARRRPAPGAVHHPEPGWAAAAESSGRVLPVVPEMAGAPDDGEFHTRPLRLATSVPQPRTPHWDD